MILALALALLVTPQATAPIQPVPQDEPIATPVLIYPAEAKKARIEGTVKLAIHVDPTGHVIGVEALSGPIALRQAAIEAYSHATYRPLLKDGKPTPADITTSVNFRLHELPPDTDQLVDRAFGPLHARCQELSAALAPISKSAPEDSAARHEALATCRQAVEMGRRFSPHAQLELRETALNDLVLLLIAPGKQSTHLAEAGDLADEGIPLVADASPHVPAAAVAHITRAEVRSLAGDLHGAEQDCTQAEEVFTTILSDAPENQRAGGYRGQLRETLLLHAVVLDRDHHPFQAKRLRKRAESI